MIKYDLKNGKTRRELKVCQDEYYVTTDDNPTKSVIGHHHDLDSLFFGPLIAELMPGVEIETKFYP